MHKNSAANILLPIMVKKYSHAKLIVHSHNTSPSSGSKIAIALHKLNRSRLYKLSDFRFACSDTAAEWMFGKDYQNKDVKIIKNGIIAQDYVYNPEVRTKMREQLGLTGKFVIGHVGAFREQKNHKFLLKVFSELDDPNAELVLVGDGPLKREVKAQAKKLGITNKIQFLGSRNDVNKLLQAFDVFVMPSLWEGLSISTIEAQASGLPLILSNKISRLTQITDDVEFISLYNIFDWVAAIEKVKDKFERKNNLPKIILNGYDIKKSSRKIYDTYTGGELI